MKKMIALVLALVMALSCAVAASAEGAKTSINVCIASEPDTLDPALNSAVDGATMIAHLFTGLANWAQDENGALTIVPACAVDLPAAVINEDGTATYTYTLVDGLKWSDGKDLTAADFVYAWKRAASEELGADYGYMFEIVKGYPNDLAVEAVDDKTLTVTLLNDVSYWNELLAFPTYLPVREDIVADESWATKPESYICNGPYTMTAWEHNSVITLTKNANYFLADTILMDEINSYLSDDANNMLANFRNGDWQLIDDVPNAEIDALKAEYPDEFFVGSQMGTYYVSWNVNANILPAGCELTGDEAEKAQAEIRFALGLLYDRNYIVTEIGKAGQQPASSFVALGLTDADGIAQFYEVAGPSTEYYGYWNTSDEAYADNWETAVETLKKYYAYDEATGQFTNFPAMEYLYNTSEGHKAIGEYLQMVLSGLGITMNMVNQEWNTFLNTRKAGDYTVARNGWLADYNDPISFLDMWTSGSGNNDSQFGKGANAMAHIYSIDLTAYGSDLKVENGTWSETYDAAILAIKTCTDKNARYGMMHAAEDLLMSTGAITPIYYYTDIYMVDSSVKGFFANPLGYKYFMYCTIGE